MAATLPYLATPGSIATALDGIAKAATPERVTQDFIKTKLQIKGGTGSAVLPFLKKIGLVGGDGRPTDLYIKVRNPHTSKQAMATAITKGYEPLRLANEYFYTLKDPELLALIIQVTGLSHDSSVAKLTLSTLKKLLPLADFEPKGDVEPEEYAGKREVVTPPDVIHHLAAGSGKLGFNLAYTINLNLPATSDQAVFNAIFKSLKEHLLSENE